MILWVFCLLHLTGASPFLFDAPIFLYQSHKSDRYMSHLLMRKVLCWLDFLRRSKGVSLEVFTCCFLDPDIMKLVTFILHLLYLSEICQCFPTAITYHTRVIPIIPAVTFKHMLLNIFSETVTDIPDVILLSPANSTH